MLSKSTADGNGESSKENKISCQKLKTIPKTFNFGIEFHDSDLDSDLISDPVPIVQSNFCEFSNTELDVASIVRSCPGNVVFNNCQININKN